MKAKFILGCFFVMAGFTASFLAVTGVKLVQNVHQMYIIKQETAERADRKESREKRQAYQQLHHPIANDLTAGK